MIYAEEGGAGRRGRRRRSASEKLGIVQLTMEHGASVAEIARAHGVNANQVFKWRRMFEKGQLGASGARSTALLPVTISASADTLEAADGAVAEQTSSGGAIHIELTGIHARQGELGLRRIQGVFQLVKRYGSAACNDACAVAFELRVAEYRFVRRYLERSLQAPHSLRQVDPLIRDLAGCSPAEPASPSPAGISSPHQPPFGQQFTANGELLRYTLVSQKGAPHSSKFHCLQLQRLKLGIAICHEPRAPVDAVKTLLIGTEAIQSLSLTN